MDIDPDTTNLNNKSADQSVSMQMNPEESLEVKVSLCHGISKRGFAILFNVDI